MAQREDDLDGEAVGAVLQGGGLYDAVHSQEPVRGFTHNHYRYPARFSPEFAREVIRAFSRPGQLIFDPFMGGGTSAVEALAEGRKFAGADTNSLAHFVTQTKTDVLDARDEALLFGWVLDLPYINRSASGGLKRPSEVRNLPVHLGSAIHQMLLAVDRLPSSRQQRFARCSILRAAQWALDCKSEVPTVPDFRARHQELFFDLFAGHQEFSERTREAFGSKSSADSARQLFYSDSALIQRRQLRGGQTADLILTSPPYLGVHVLYHRWQVLGRRETGAPYWIVGKPPENSSIPFTFAHRRSKSALRYFEGLKRCFKACHSLLRSKGYMVQLVAFANAEEQLPAYLATVEACGFDRSDLMTPQQKRHVVRDVPNRRWYALLGNQSKSSKEYLLVHQRRD
jgi:hypothetical protein